jgi:hypothetical protein
MSEGKVEYDQTRMGALRLLASATPDHFTKEDIQYLVKLVDALKTRTNELEFENSQLREHAAELERRLAAR